jgi:hypothetical protein
MRAAPGGGGGAGTTLTKRCVTHPSHALGARARVASTARSPLISLRKTRRIEFSKATRADTGFPSAAQSAAARAGAGSGAGAAGGPPAKAETVTVEVRSGDASGAQNSLGAKKNL